MDAYIGEVRIFAGNFTPRDWLDCNGQVVQVQQYQALYAVLGNTYGGTAPSTFALPNLDGRIPLHQGTGNGLTPRALGASGGQAAVTLDTTQIPSHRHIAQAIDTPGASKNPSGEVWGRTPKAGRPTPFDTNNFDPTLDAMMNPQAVAVAGASLAHNNMQPYLPVRFIICANGIYPAQG